MQILRFISHFLSISFDKHKCEYKKTGNVFLEYGNIGTSPYAAMDLNPYLHRLVVNSQAWHTTQSLVSH